MTENMQRPVGRFAVTLPLGVLIATGLLGCQEPDLGAMKLQEGRVLVAVCEQVDAVSLEGRVRPEDSPSANQAVIWTATGETKIDDGTVLEFGLAPEGMETGVSPNPGDLADQRIVVSVEDSGGGYWLLGALWSDLREENWLDQSGAYRDSPCPAD